MIDLIGRDYVFFLRCLNIRPPCSRSICPASNSGLCLEPIKMNVRLTQMPRLIMVLGSLYKHGVRRVDLKKDIGPSLRPLNPKA